jgi:hypothetical protein
MPTTINGTRRGHLVPTKMFFMVLTSALLQARLGCQFLPLYLYDATTSGFGFKNLSNRIR